MSAVSRPNLLLLLLVVVVVVVVVMVVLRLLLTLPRGHNVGSQQPIDRTKPLTPVLFLSSRYPLCC